MTVVSAVSRLIVVSEQHDTDMKNNPLLMSENTKYSINYACVRTVMLGVRPTFFDPCVFRTRCFLSEYPTGSMAPGRRRRGFLGPKHRAPPAAAAERANKYHKSTNHDENVQDPKREERQLFR